MKAAAEVVTRLPARTSGRAASTTSPGRCSPPAPSSSRSRPRASPAAAGSGTPRCSPPRPALAAARHHQLGPRRHGARRARAASRGPSGRRCVAGVLLGARDRDQALPGAVPRAAARAVLAHPAAARVAHGRGRDRRHRPAARRARLPRQPRSSPTSAARRRRSRPARSTGSATRGCSALPPHVDVPSPTDAGGDRRGHQRRLPLRRAQPDPRRRLGLAATSPLGKLRTPERQPAQRRHRPGARPRPAAGRAAVGAQPGGRGHASLRRPCC